jgi:molybdopterin/thiamine biosynthesis adenylyltransferase
MTELLDSEKRRFSKIMEIEGLGLETITRLKNSKIAIVGLTGVGVSTLIALITSGVSHVKVVDHLTIDEFNLPQGCLFSRGDIGKLKTIAIKEKLTNLHMVERVAIKNVELRSSNIDEVLDGAEIIVYASYDRETIKLISDFCVRNRKLFIWTVGCNFNSYLLCADPDNVAVLVDKAVSLVDRIFKSDYYYPSYVSAVAGGSAAAVAVNALLGKSASFLRRCDVNTFEMEQL